MSLQKTRIRNWVILLFIIGFSALRALSPEQFGIWANFTPVGAIALFGGTYLKNKWQAFLFPILILMASDLVINYGYLGKITLMYEGVAWVYLSFILIVLLGTYMKKVKPINVFLSALVAVLIHWIIADIGVWYMNPAFEQNLSGYVQCLIMAIPFERNFMAGTLLYSAIMFGGFELVKSYVPRLTIKTV